MKGKRFVLAAMALLLAVMCLAPAAPARAWTPYDKVTYANADPERYWIELDLTNCITTVYEQDEEGEYTRIVRQSVCSPGTSATPTPTGTYTLNTKRRRFGYFSEYNCYAQYWVNVVGGIYFHSILYNRPIEGNFTRTSYNALGSPASHGCIRMLVEDVRWIYYNCPPGTKVTITKKKALDKALHDSLMPKVSASKYVPEPDEYEAEARPEPTGTVNAAAVLTDKNGAYSQRVERGETVTILESGEKRTKVQLSSGKTGYLENGLIDFIDNGPGQYTVTSRITRTAKMYEKPTNTIEPFATLPKGTEVKILSSTVYFHLVEANGKKGYVLKTSIETVTERLEEQEPEGEEEEPDSSDEQEEEGEDNAYFTILRVKSKQANLYARPTNTEEPIGCYGKGSDLYMIGEPTKYYYNVRVGDQTGYILKDSVAAYRVTIGPDEEYESKVYPIELPGIEEEAPDEEANSEYEEVG